MVSLPLNGFSLSLPLGSEAKQGQSLRWMVIFWHRVFFLWIFGESSSFFGRKIQTFCLSYLVENEKNSYPKYRGCPDWDAIGRRVTWLSAAAGKAAIPLSSPPRIPLH